MNQVMISFSVLVSSSLNSHSAPIHSNDYCAMYDICGQRTDGKVLNCPYGSLSVKPDDLFSAKIQSLCPTITGNVCCTETQFDTLRSQVQQAVPFLVGCPACLRNFLNLFCELSCSPNQSLFINVTSVAEVGGNLTVDGIDYHITDMFGEGLYESCKEVKFGTMNTRAINFVGGGAQNFREWFAFIGQKAPPGFPGSPYAINFKSSSPELSAMAPMNLSTYSCGDTSLGCSCGDCPSSPACSSPEPLPPPHEEDSCSFRLGPLKVRCIELSMALLYILLVSSFFGWATFSRTRDITQPDGSSESLVRLLEGDGINSELKESTLGVKGKRHAHLSPVQRYMATFYK
ncbi:BnaAnng36400D [Brassica napus]|uniref:BnaAnng36400D protein n=1 Tax=Brassica napus TaxID=3708 RepID=A0A078JUE7_BRANA|nr:BnaAnng36400D [Brassica napus]